MTEAPTPHSCGCECCARWTHVYAGLAPRMAAASIRLLTTLLYDDSLVSQGRNIPASQLPIDDE